MNLVRLWHAVIAVLGMAALVAQFVLVLDDGSSVVNLFSYFTIQSNILVAITAALISADPERDERWFQVLRMAALVGITVTGIVYATILAGSIELSGLRLALDLVFHYIIPWASVIGYLALTPRTRFDAVAWWFLVWPVIWLGYTLVRAEVSEPVYKLGDTLTGPVPYDFLDIDKHGGLSVTIVSVVITVLAVLLAAGYRWMSRRPRRSATTSNT